MPGPKMGPRPIDFDEELIRQSPTFMKWRKLESGEKLRYACREFVKGREDDEERLMRRIMIARRNNLKDHGILKQARRLRPRPVPMMTMMMTRSPPPPPPLIVDTTNGKGATTKTDHVSDNQSNAKESPTSYSDEQVRAEMDVEAVRKTRSYRHWETLAPGQTFIYNQMYTKGIDNHDWLLRKNIWRRMRYRRENKKIIQQLVLQPSAIEAAVAAAVQSQAANMAAIVLAHRTHHHGHTDSNGCGTDHQDDDVDDSIMMCDTIAQAALDAQLAFQTFRVEEEEAVAVAAAAAVAAATAVANGDHHRDNDDGDDDEYHDHDDDQRHSDDTAQQQQEQQQYDHHNDSDDMLDVTAAADDAVEVVVDDPLLGEEVSV